MKKVEILLLGHTGFIGKNLSHMLEREYGTGYLGLSFPEIDLLEENSLSKILRVVDSGTTLIFAAGVKRQFGDDLEAFQKNIQMSQNVCKLLASKPLKKVIFFSSAAVYGEETEAINVDEGTSVNPTSYYGLAKFTAERLLQKACTSNGITSLLCIRPPLIYGANDFGGTYGPSAFCEATINKKSICLWGDGTELREFIYIEDFIKIMHFLIQSSETGILNIASGKSNSFLDAINIIKKKYPNIIISNKARSKLKVNVTFNSQSLKNILPKNFTFKSLEFGIDNILREMS